MHLGGPYHRRLLIAAVLGAVVWAALVARLAQIQIADHGRYASEALRQHERRVILPARRGSILDRRGEALAVDVSNPSLFVDPHEVADPDRVVNELTRRFHLDRSRVRAAVRSQGGFAWVARDFIDRSEAEHAMRELPGVFIRDEQKRMYPSGAAAAHLVGFTNRDGRGLEGMEAMHDRVLRGRDGWTTEYVDARGRGWRPPRSALASSRCGDSVVLTIDRRFQEIAENELHRAVEKANARGGTVVIVDPRTGEILALANEPCYDPEAASSSPPDGRRNRAVTDLFEPGSTFKIVCASAAIEKGRVRRDTQFDTGDGVKKISGVSLHDAHAHGTIPFEEVIAYSSNIGTALAAVLVGEEDIYRYARRFGFGLRTGIDLPGEIPGVLRPVESWSGRSLITVAIGQEVSVSAIELVMAFSALANDGVLMRPFVTRAVLDADGQVVSRTEPQRVRRVVSSETARTVREFLSMGVEEGTGRNAALAWCSVGGKTGTAQKFVNGTFKNGLYVSSFCGFLPADDPEIVCLVVIDEPRGAYYGGTVAAPVFRNIVAGLAAADMGLLARFGRPLEALDEDSPWSASSIPPADSLMVLIAAEKKVAVSRQAGASLGPQAVAAPQADLGRAKEAPEAAGLLVEVPDLRGLTAREAYRRLSRALLETELVGSGRVVSQEPPAGTTVSRGQVCVLHLEGGPDQEDPSRPVHGGL
jgi:cell division protein FtsI (penicillin-binding protein 3)